MGSNLEWRVGWWWKEVECQWCGNLSDEGPLLGDRFG